MNATPVQMKYRVERGESWRNRQTRVAKADGTSDARQKHCIN